LRVEELRTSLETTVWEPFIPERQVVKEMEGAGVPLAEFGRDARDVLEAVDVLLGRLLWLDDDWRAARPLRDPEVLFAAYNMRAARGAAQNKTAVS
jgi:hypothetical protein